MSYTPFYAKAMQDKQPEQKEGDGAVLQPQSQPDAVKTDVDGDGKVTELPEVEVTAPAAPAAVITTQANKPAPAAPAAVTDRVPGLPVEALGKYLQQQEEEEEYLKAHPWVAESDLSVLYDKYKDKTPAQMIYDISQYRNKHGQRLNEEELALLLAGRDPNRSKKEVTKEKRRAYWADMINEIGNVLAHFYNYGRAKAGSPAATITPNKSDNVARLRAADMAMRQRGYNDYVNAMANAEKRRQAREDLDYKLKMQEAQEQRRLANQKALKEHDWLSPKYKLELERLGKDLEDKDTQHELNKAKLAYQMMINEGKSTEQALEISYKRLRNALTNKKLNEGDGKPYKVGDQSYSDAYAAYKRGVILYNQTHPNNQKKVVKSTKFDSKPNEYLKEVGVKTN